MTEQTFKVEVTRVEHRPALDLVTLDLEVQDEAVRTALQKALLAGIGHGRDVSLTVKVEPKPFRAGYYRRIDFAGAMNDARWYTSPPWKESWVGAAACRESNWERVSVIVEDD